MVLEKCETIVRNWQTFARRGRKKQGNRCFFFDMNELKEERQRGSIFLPIAILNCLSTLLSPIEEEPVRVSFCSIQTLNSRVLASGAAWGLFACYLNTFKSDVRCNTSS